MTSNKTGQGDQAIGGQTYESSWRDLHATAVSQGCLSFTLSVPVAYLIV